RQLDREDASQAFAHIVASRFDLCALGELVLLDVLIQRPSHGAAQRGQMCSAVALRDVIGETQYRLLVGVVPLHRNFDTDSIALTDRMKNMRMQYVFRTIDELDERANPAGELEDLFLATTLIDQLDAHSVVEKRKLAQALGQNVV